MRLRTIVTATLSVAALAIGAAVAAEPADHRLLLWDDDQGDAVPVDAYVVEPDATSRPLGATEALAWTAEGGEVIVLGEAEVTAVDVGTGDERLVADVRGSVSPDERYVAYAQTVGEGPDRWTQMYVKPAIGGEPVAVGALVPESGRVSRPVWDQQSHRFAWIGDGPAVWLADVSGQARRLTGPDLDAHQVAWSPKADELVFVAAPDGADAGTRSELYLVSTDGDEVSRLSNIGADGGSVRPEVAPAWHPDATRIAVATRDETSGYRLTVVGAHSGEAVAISDHSDASRGGRLSWTPDGLQLAFDVAADDPDCDCARWDTWVLDLAEQARHGVDADGDTSVTSSERHPVFAPGIARRRAGVTRIQTAVAISRHTFEAADVAVLARADLYPDALSGAPLAHAHDAPLLLTSTDHLDGEVAAELVRLGVGTVFLLGSEAALTSGVVDDLEELGIADVRRRGGADRNGTARLVAKELGPSDHAFIVEGRDADPSRGWPDAVSVAPLAAHVGSPVLLVETDLLPDETARALDEVGVERATLIGGPAAIGTDVADEIEARGIAVDRLAGQDRYATSMEVAEAGAAVGLDPARSWFATGRDWPDALGAGPAVAASGGVLVLLDGFDLDGSPPARVWLDTVDFERIVLVGGPDAIDPRVAVEIERRAGP